MNIEEFEKSKRELSELRKQNTKQILMNDERTRMAQVNKLEYKAGKIVALSTFVYFVLLISSTFLTKSFGTAFLTNIFPGFSFPIALIGSSLGIGTIGSKIFDKKFEIKKRLKSFSKAKTQNEKLEEEIYYQIELEKSLNRNKVLEETFKVLESNQSMLSKISNRYELNDKCVSHSKAEAEQKAKELSDIIKAQYEELDIAITKKVLHDRFWRIRHKFHKISDLLVVSMISGIFTMCLVTFPTMVLSVVPTIPIAASFVIGLVSSGIYMLKRNSDYRKVFNILNAKLEKNALAENCDKTLEGVYEEEQEIKAIIEKLIRELSLAEVKRKENERFLETPTTLEEKKDFLFDDLSKTHINEKSKEDVLSHPEKYLGCDARTRMGKFYTDEEHEQYIEDSLKRDLSGSDEKGPKLIKKKNN